MTYTLTSKKNIVKIAARLEKLDMQEQQSILAQINATIILKKGIPKIANPAKDLKPLTMAQIDAIKHKARKLKPHAK